MPQPINREALRQELERLDKVGINGRLNPSYGDGYYAVSLEKKYGMTLADLRRVASGEEPKTAGPKELHPITLKELKTWARKPPPVFQRLMVGHWQNADRVHRLLQALDSYHNR